MLTCATCTPSHSTRVSLPFFPHKVVGIEALPPVEAREVRAIQQRVADFKQRQGQVAMASRVSDLRLELARRLTERGLDARALFLKSDVDRDGTCVGVWCVGGGWLHTCCDLVLRFWIQRGTVSVRRVTCMGCGVPHLVPHTGYHTQSTAIP